MNVTAWVVFVFFFFFKQKTAYEMRISDWSSDVCSSDLTSKPFRTLLEERLGPVSYFIGGPKGMPYKPRADSTAHILSEKGWQRRGVLYVGNTTDDMQPAANGGLHFVNVLWHSGDSPYGLNFAPPRHVPTTQRRGGGK